MKSRYTLLSGREVDINYFAEWRPQLWRRPLVHVLDSFGDLRGKRVLEIGGRSGRLTSLLAMMGAEVTMIETGKLEEARRETAKWGVQDQVHLIRSKGGFDELKGAKFDVICTKSVLWSIANLDGFLQVLESHLDEGGKVGFIENNLGGNLIRWFRRVIVHKGKFDYEDAYFGIHPGQFVLFEKRFEFTQIKLHRKLTYTITGSKMTQAR